MLRFLLRSLRPSREHLLAGQTVKAPPRQKGPRRGVTMAGMKRCECLYVGKQSLKNIPNLKLKNKKIKKFPSSLKLPPVSKLKRKTKRSLKLISTLQGFPYSWRWKTRGPFPQMPAEGAAGAWKHACPTPRDARPGPVQVGLRRAQRAKESA